jgi:predicted GIY-YIG superfamily endonuclease
MASNNASALYIGVTSNLARRIGEHKSHSIEGFTKKYNCVNLVYFEETQNIEDAIAREKQLKKWNRKKKETLIATMNPEWKDLSSDWD